MNKNILLAVLLFFSFLGALLYIVPLEVPLCLDKVFHFLGFAFLSLLAILTFVLFFGRKPLNYFLFFFLSFGGLVAGASEFSQKFVEGRSCSIEDWFMNLMGILIVSLIVFFVNIKFSKSVSM